MKRQDIIIVVLLFAALMAWPFLAKKFFPPPAPVRPSELRGSAPAPEPATISESAPAPDPVPAPPAVASAPSWPHDEKPDAAPAVAIPRRPERRLSLANDDMVVTVSSWGGGVAAVEMKHYRTTPDRDSAPLVLNFSNFQALVYAGIPGLGVSDDFDLALTDGNTAIALSKKTAAGLSFVRTISLGENYRLKIEDVFSNPGSAPVMLGDHEMRIGIMRSTGETRGMGLNYLGVDVLPAAAGEGVVFWSGKLAKLFKAEMKERNLPGVPPSISRKEHRPVDWVAVKSKFFVQILAPEGGAAAYRLNAERMPAPGEREDSRKMPKNAELESVSASVCFQGAALAPGESLKRSARYYVGPKKYSILKRLDLRQEEVMEFGWWKPVCKLLLIIMNAAYDIIPNYGIAIILLTVLIRIVFWPLTHKSTESMKRMQEIQPLMMELRAKYKDNPKKIQEETLALYRKHKVNPLGGCLPMLIQIPVFFALFVVLRSSIELRFAGFLWIPDLSEPENLLPGMLPYPIGALNILPLIMAATMFWQQKLTPMSSADPAQQKMMLWFMPIMMLVMFYKMPSALVFYWTISQVLMIGQLLIQQKRTAMNKARESA